MRYLVDLMVILEMMLTHLSWRRQNYDFLPTNTNCITTERNYIVLWNWSTMQLVWSSLISSMNGSYLRYPKVGGDPRTWEKAFKRGRAWLPQRRITLRFKVK